MEPLVNNLDPQLPGEPPGGLEPALPLKGGTVLPPDAPRGMPCWVPVRLLRCPERTAKGLKMYRRLAYLAGWVLDNTGPKGASAAHYEWGLGARRWDLPLLARSNAAWLTESPFSRNASFLDRLSDPSDLSEASAADTLEYTRRRIREYGVARRVFTGPSVTREEAARRVAAELSVVVDFEPDPPGRK